MSMRGPDHRIEVVVSVIIAICMIFLNHTINQKIKLITTSDYTVISTGSTSGSITYNFMSNENTFAYRLEDMNAIEVYDKNFNKQLSLRISDDHISYKLLSSEKIASLEKVFYSYDSGHVNIELNGSREDVYFTWGINDRGEKQLTVIYDAGHLVDGLWIIPFLCYIILILIFGLVLMHRIHFQNTRIRYFKENQDRIQSTLR